MSVPSREVAGLAIEIEVAQVLAELKRIGSATDAAGKDMVAALGKRVRQAEKEVKRARQEAEKAGSAVKVFGDKAGEAGNGLGKFAQAAGVLPGPLGQIAQTLADVADGAELAGQVGEAFGATLSRVVAVSGGLAGGLALVGAAYVAVTSDIERARAETETYRQINDSLVGTLRAVEDAERDLSVALGYSTEAQAKHDAANIAAKRGVEDFAKAQEEQRKALRDSASTNEEILRYLDNYNKLTLGAATGGIMLADSIFGFSESIESANSQLAALDAAVMAEAENQKKLRYTVQATTAATEEGAETDKKAAGSKRALAGATEAVSTALRESLALMEEDSRLTAQVADGIEGLRKAADDAADARLSGEAKVNDALDERLAQLEAEYQAVNRLASTDAERSAATDAYLSARTEAERTAAFEIEKIRDEAARREVERMADLRAQQLAQAQEVGGYVVDGLGMIAAAHDDAYQIAADGVSRLEAQLAASEQYLTDAQKQALEGRIDAQKDAAQKQFEAAKRAKVAEALASTALAAINAVAQSPPPSPFGLIGAGIATAFGLAAAADIQSQQFTAYAGGLPDEVPATLHRNEAVLSQQGRATLGDDEIRRANAGVSGAPRDARLVVMMGHKVLDEPVARTIQGGGRLSKEISARTKTGPANLGSY